MPQLIRAAGMVWYRREDYPRILQIMSDAEKLPRTYDAWAQGAESGEKKFKADGVIVVRAVIDPDTFPNWCAVRGLEINAKARNAFASEVAYNEVKRTH